MKSDAEWSEAPYPHGRGEPWVGEPGTSRPTARQRTRRGMAVRLDDDTAMSGHSVDAGVDDVGPARVRPSSISSPRPSKTSTRRSTPARSPPRSWCSSTSIGSPPTTRRTEDQRGHHAQSRGARHRARARCRAQGEGPAQPAARRAGGAQGSVRHQGHADQRRISSARELAAALDATVVARLRDAGAIILAKVNMSDWFGRPPPGDQSTVLGRTNNPYNLGLSRPAARAAAPAPRSRRYSPRSGSAARPACRSAIRRLTTASWASRPRAD